ncbi:MAG: acetate kinase [Candidatus Peregrinibacteria bacterium]
MKILVINAGSSSIKSTLFESTPKALTFLAKFHVDGIGLSRCKYSFKSDTKNLGLTTQIKTHEAGIKLLLQTLKNTETISSYSEIKAIGHRVVHGGEKYTASTLINPQVLKAIHNLEELAPLHNPANLSAIKACKKILPKTKQVAVFDTAFHQTMPPKAFLYGLPYNLYTKHQIRRYGFHGTSHKYVTNQAVKLLKKKNLKIISCHLGNGSSITASLNGKSVDTSMGFTPLEGVMMGTRSGSIDPAIIFHLKDKLKMKPDQIEDLLNEKSGLKGFSEISQDMREIYQESKKGNRQALLTIELLSYQIAKYVGAFAAALNGLDCLIFTGGLGENAFYIREQVASYLSHLNLKLNTSKNKEITAPTPLTQPEKISDTHSKVQVLVIPTNEELQIAEETIKI